MPTPVATRFTQWEFTNAELFAASRFSQLQLMLIQSLIADAAIRKNNLTFDPQNAVNFAQQEAEATGEISAYEHLLMLATELTPPEASESEAKADISNNSSKPDAELKLQT